MSVRGTAMLLCCVLTLSIFAQVSGATAQPTSDAGVPVVYRGQEIVRIHRGFGNLGPAERARLASQRLEQFVRDITFDPTRVTVADRETYSELLYDDRVLSIITDEDAKASGRPRVEFARQVRNRVVEVVIGTRAEFSAGSIAIGVGWALLATVILAVLVRLLARVRRAAVARIERWFHRLTDPQTAGAGPATRVGSLIRTAPSLASAGVAIVLAVVWVGVVLQVLPWSRPLARLIYGYALAPFQTLWFGLLRIVPNLFYLGAIALTTFLVMRVVRAFFTEIKAGTIRLASFPDDWADPTYKLVRALLLAVAVVGAFPYIPGSQSPAFQGISIFLGLLVSLSSSSALSNIIAGTILTYTRAFKVGDVVRIGETVGEVTIRRLLATHVRTSKNVVVSIPNSLILTVQVLNYTMLADERGLVAHTSVAIGYDAPWSTVHKLLIAAALRTEGVLADPAPYVLQTALNDFSVTYEINALVASPVRLSQIYSALHANIQECFNEAGLEIMAPNYYALRDGNRVTTPRQYLSPDYVAPVRDVAGEE